MVNFSIKKRVKALAAINNSSAFNFTTNACKKQDGGNEWTKDM